MAATNTEPFFAMVVPRGRALGEPVRYECNGRQWLRRDGEPAEQFRQRVRDAVALNSSASEPTVLGFDRL